MVFVILIWTYTDRHGLSLTLLEKSKLDYNIKPRIIKLKLKSEFIMINVDSNKIQDFLYLTRYYDIKSFHRQKASSITKIYESKHSNISKKQYDKRIDAYYLLLQKKNKSILNIFFESNRFNSVDYFNTSFISNDVNIVKLNCIKHITHYNNNSWLCSSTNEYDNNKYIDISNINDFFLYQYVSEYKNYSDPKCKTISFMPGVGICNAFPTNKRINVSLKVSLKSDINKKIIKRLFAKSNSTKFYIDYHPSWLIPHNKKFIIFDEQEKITTINFQLLNTSDKSKLKDKIIFRNEIYNDLFYETYIFLYKPQAIYIDSITNEVYCKKSYLKKYEIEVNIQLITKGKGELNIFFFGNGINSKEKIVSHEETTAKHNIRLSMDTRQIFLKKNKKMMLWIYSDSKIINKNFFKIPLNINPSRLAFFPVVKLDWLNIAWGSIQSQCIHFYWQDTLQPCNDLEIIIPDKLKHALNVTKLYNQQDKVLFNLNSSILEPDEYIEQVVEIKVKNNYEINQKYEIPIQIKTYSADCNISIIQRPWCKPGRFDCVIISIFNKGKEAFKIFNLKFKYNNFLRYANFWDLTESEIPEIQPDEYKEMIFFPKAKAKWFKPLHIKDIIEISCNDKNQPLIKNKISIYIAPKQFFMACYHKYKLRKQRLKGKIK